jgi:hypothetical protein
VSLAVSSADVSWMDTPSTILNLGTIHYSI